MVEKLDFLDKNFKFIANHDEYFIGETTCEGDYTDWKSDKKIKDGWGMFRGMTMVSYKGYSGDLPRFAGDTAAFEEFTIFYKDLDVSELTYSELQKLVLSEKRDAKIWTIIT